MGDNNDEGVLGGAQQQLMLGGRGLDQVCVGLWGGGVQGAEVAVVAAEVAEVGVASVVVAYVVVVAVVAVDVEVEAILTSWGMD